MRIRSFDISQVGSAWRLITFDDDGNVQDIHEVEDPERIFGILALHVLPADFFHAVNDQRRLKKQRLL